MALAIHSVSVIPAQCAEMVVSTPSGPVMRCIKVSQRAIRVQDSRGSENRCGEAQACAQEDRGGEKVADCRAIDCLHGDLPSTNEGLKLMFQHSRSKRNCQKRVASCKRHFFAILNNMNLLKTLGFTGSGATLISYPNPGPLTNKLDQKRCF